ncbi:lachesin-like [Lineus longissimus]|uniref:lachesin-like n=1 Tax=Lineus longissimus TaxID=88925 RepID=UPI002B4F5A42
MRHLIYLVCVLPLLVFSVHGQGSEPKISKSIDQESKPAGAEGKLSCHVSNKDFAAVIWQKGEGNDAQMISRDHQIIKRNPVDSSGELKYMIYVESATASETVYTLGVRRLTMDDGGSYTCMLMLPGVDNADYPRQTGQLTVQLPPKIQTSETTTLLDIVAGETAVLKCAASGVPEPRISWSRANGLALGNGKLTVYGNELVIKNVNDTARGVYKCKADNNVRPPAATDITLRVRYPPRLIPFRSTVGQAADRNYDVEISCRISGDPMPDLHWYKKGNTGELERIMNDNKHEIHVIEMHPGQPTMGMSRWLIMRIFNLQYGDYGNYTCRGINIYGKGDGIITLYRTSTCQNTGTKCSVDSRGGATGLSTTITTVLLPLVMIPFMLR